LIAVPFAGLQAQASDAAPPGATALQGGLARWSGADARECGIHGHRYAAVSAPADGTVVLAADHFYAGRSVMVDHGGGLMTMVFHLDEIAVEQGAEVKRGDTLGVVGESGRTTGPHLHFGARWHDQRIDAAALLGDPARLPGIGESATQQPAADVKAVETAAGRSTAEDAAGEN